jgi:putative nucleotidyltransferase with HDIG domain
LWVQFFSNYYASNDRIGRAMSMNGVRDVLEARCPGLYDRIERMLIEAEARFNRQTDQGSSEFLVEHTRRTAAIAHKISRLEGVDPFLPLVVALFHDAGKFHEGEYHADDIPEEEHAANLAEGMLAEFGLDRGEIDAVRDALRALYNDKLPCVGACRVVQDADRLDKLGALGVSAFFTKAALRGRGLIEALGQAASRELTYAQAAPRSMFTETGRQLATAQAAKSVAFFDALLDDLENWGIASFERRTIVLQEDFRTRDGALVQSMEVTIVMPRSCPDCETALALTHRRGRGIKCEKLMARFACADCGYAGETSFCLPVFA